LKILEFQGRWISITARPPLTHAPTYQISAIYSWVIDDWAEHIVSPRFSAGNFVRHSG